MYRSLFLCSLMLAAAHASAGDSTLDAAIGGGLGGAAGAAIGNEVGGRDGAIIGGAIGGAAGAAVTTRPNSGSGGHAPQPSHTHHPASAPAYRSDGFCPPGQAKKGRC